MFDQWLRRPQRRLLTPLARQLSRWAGPTTWTILAAVVGIAAGLAAFGRYWSLALLLWLSNRLLDGLDGTVARITHRQSDLGAYLDIVLDHLVYVALPLAITAQEPTVPRCLALAILFSSFYINNASWMYLAALLEKRNQGAASRGELTSITMPTGLVEGSETILFYTLFLLLPNYQVTLYSIMAALVFCSAGQRIAFACSHLQEATLNEPTEKTSAKIDTRID